MPRTASEDGTGAYDPAMVLWFARNVSPEFFGELVNQSFLLADPDDEVTFRMLQEAADRDRYDITFGWVDSIFVKVFQGAPELWAFGYF